MIFAVLFECLPTTSATVWIELQCKFGSVPCNFEWHKKSGTWTGKWEKKKNNCHAFFIKFPSNDYSEIVISVYAMTVSEIKQNRVEIGCVRFHIYSICLKSSFDCKYFRVWDIHEFHWLWLTQIMVIVHNWNISMEAHVKKIHPRNYHHKSIFTVIQWLERYNFFWINDTKI